MDYYFGKKISEMALSILSKLLFYRGMTAGQIARMLHHDRPTLSQEKSVYNYLAKLKKQKLIAAHRLQDTFSRGSIYYLTQAGYEMMLHYLNIDVNKKATGWMNGSNLFSLADIKYEIFRPPLDQTAHHLLLVEFFIQLLEQCHNHHFGGLHRLNLYAAHTYFDATNNKLRYRPDAEIILEDRRIFAIEIDRGTESYEQLCKKFRTYRNYFDQHLNDNKIRLPQGILFVVENKRYNHGMKRRWETIVKAFFNEIGTHHSRLNVIMCTLDNVENFIRLEQQRIFYEQLMHEQVQIALSKEYLKVIQYGQYNDKKLISNSYTLALNDTTFDVYFDYNAHEYETLVYSKYLNFRNAKLLHAKSQDHAKGLKFGDWFANIGCLSNQPYLLDHVKVPTGEGVFFPIDDLSKIAKYHELEVGNG